MIDIRKLKTLLDLVSESGIGELEITDGDDRIRIVNAQKAAPAAAPAVAAQPAPVVVAAAPSAPAPQPAAQAAPAAAPAAQGTPLNSPMVGTFYRSSAPGAKPFVEVGDKVKKGQVVCIIEAMKLLNEVEAESDGVVKEICAENGQPVEFGQPLFILG